MLLPSRINFIPFTLTCAALLFISGCASKSEKEDDLNKNVDQQILLTSQQIQKTQSELYQAGVINSVPKKLPPIISGKFNAITVTWQGDLKDFLKEIAKAENKEFLTTGVQSPLPISISVKNEPLIYVYQLLEAQIGYRAKISRSASKIILQYSTIK